MAKDRLHSKDDGEEKQPDTNDADLDAMCDIDDVNGKTTDSKEETPGKTPVKVPTVEGGESSLLSDLPHDRMEAARELDYTQLAPCIELGGIDEIWDSISILFSRLHNTVDALTKKEYRSVNEQKVKELKVVLDLVLGDCDVFNDKLEELLQ